MIGDPYLSYFAIFLSFFVVVVIFYAIIACRSRPELVSSIGGTA